MLCMDLYNLFPRSYYAKPSLKMAGLGGDLQGQVLIHEQDSNSLYLLSPSNKELRSLNFKSIVDNTKEKLTRHFSIEKGKFVMSSEFAHGNKIVVYQEDSNKMDVVDLVDGTTQHITMPFVIGKFHPFSRDLWLICETGTDRKYLLTKPYPEAPVPCVLHPVTSNNLGGVENEDWKSISTRSLPPGALSAAVGAEKGSKSNRLLVGSEDYATIAVAEPDRLLEKSPVSFYSFKKKEEQGNTTSQSGEYYYQKQLENLCGVGGGGGWGEEEQVRGTMFPVFVALNVEACSHLYCTQCCRQCLQRVASLLNHAARSIVGNVAPCF